MEQRHSQGIRAALIVTSLIVFLGLLIGLIWNWIFALTFIVGSLFFALCCFLSYYIRAAFSFNNIVDTNMNIFTALLANSISIRERPPRPGSEVETFKPFIFKQDKEKELEDMRVRALLRQVFPDEEHS